MENLKMNAPSFIEGQKADADAAYQRMDITRKMLKEYKRSINDTNTVDVAGELKLLYLQLENTAHAIIEHEQLLIQQGE